MHGFDTQRKHGSSRSSAASSGSIGPRGLRPFCAVAPGGPRSGGASRGRSLLTWLGVIAILVAPLGRVPSAAAAEPLARVFLLPTEVDGRVSRFTAGKVGDLVASAFPLEERVAWVEVGALRAPEPTASTESPRGRRGGRAPAPSPAGPKAGSRASQGPLARAARELEVARGHARAGRHAAAIKGFTAAIASHVAGLGELVDLAPYREALLERALSYLAAGYADNADEEFLRVLALDPSASLPESASEAARSAFARVAASVSGSAGALTVMAEPAGAVVTVDGRIVQTAPGHFADLPRGEHVVRVAADGHVAAGRLVTLGEGPVEVGFTLEVGSPAAHAPTPVSPTPTHTADGQASGSTSAAGVVSALAARVREGDLGPAFEALASPLAARNGLAGLVFTRLVPRTSGRGVTLTAFVWLPGGTGVASVAEAELSEDLSGVQLAVLDLAEQAAAAIGRFPSAQRVVSVPRLEVGSVAGSAPAAPSGLAAPVPAAPSGLAAPVPAAPSPVTRPATPEPTAAPPERVADHTPSPIRPDRRRAPHPARPDEPGAEPDDGPDPEPEASPPARVRRPAPESPLRFDPPPEVSRARPRARVRETAAEANSDTPFYASWWFWTLTVGAVAGGSTAAILATQTQGAPRTWRATVSW